MIIDWTTIIIGVIGISLGASGATLATFIFFPKHTKKKEDSDVIKQDASAAKEMLELNQSLSNFYGSIIDGLQDTITKQHEIIANKDAHFQRLQIEMEENKKKIHLLSFTQSEHERKIKGITDTLKQEIGKKQYAEENICLDKKCEIRKPKLGTYKTENPTIFE